MQFHKIGHAENDWKSGPRLPVNQF